MTSLAIQAEPLNRHFASGRLLNVLILDDLEADRVRIRRLLRKAGLEFQLYEAQDLKSFRHQIDQAEMHFVIIDYNLDIENGMDALKILASHENQVGALPIMVTSVDRWDTAVEAMRMGCADYLVKEQLSVDAVRKSVVSAFERRILISAVKESHTSRHEITSAVRQFASTCGPEIRSVLSATLRRTRAMRQEPALSPVFSENLTSLEENCQDIFGFLSSIADLIETLDGPKTQRLAAG